MKNVVLIGMPGAGKSTIGVLLAKSLLMNFADTDLSIQKEYNLSLCEIIKREGTKRFLEIEEEVILKTNFESTVIATGGSAVYGERAMEKLKKNGTCIFLDLPLFELKKRLSNISTRGVAMEKGETLEELFEKRTPLYEKYADFKISCAGLTAEECADKCIEVLF